jgi:hypothetical protein
MASGDMPSYGALSYAHDFPGLGGTADRERKIQLAQQGQTSQEVQGIQGRASQEAINRAQGDVQQAVEASRASAQMRAAQIAADAQRDAARIAAAARNRGNRDTAYSGRELYAKGGTVKNDHPFNKSFDNALLMKSRRK